MKDQIAQRNETTRKNDDWCCMWLDDMKILIDIKWFGKCIVGVVSIFTNKISSKNEIKCQKLKV